MGLMLAPIEGTPYVGGNAPGFQSVSAAGLQVLVKSNLTATSDPTSGDDSGAGYRIGSRWTNTITGKVWEAVSVATATAVWKDLTATTPPAGSGTEFQYRASATSFGAITGSSWAGGVATLPTLAVSDLTAGRIPYVGTAGRLVDSGNLLWTNATSKLTVTGSTGTGWEIGKDILCNNDGVHQTIGVSGYNSELQIVLSRACAIKMRDDYTNAIDFYSYSGYRFFTSQPGSDDVVASVDGNGSFVLTPRAITTVPLAISLASGQTADAFQVTSYGGTAGNLFSINKDGVLQFSRQGATVGGTITGGTWNNDLTVTGGSACYLSGIYHMVQMRSDGGFSWANSTTNDGLSTIDLKLSRNAAGVIEVNNGTANQYRDILVRSIGLGVTPPGTTGDVRILGTAYGGNGSKISDITWENGGNYRAGIRTVYDTTTANYGGSFEFYTGGQSTTWPGNLNKSLVVAGSGATTINAASGSPLTVQANGTTGLSVDSSADTTIAYEKKLIIGGVNQNYFICPAGGTTYLRSPVTGDVMQIGASAGSRLNLVSGRLYGVASLYIAGPSYEADPYALLSMNRGSSGDPALYIQRASGAAIGVVPDGAATTTSYVFSVAGPTGAIASGTATASAQIHVIKTTEQLRLGYDATNYFSTTVASNGDTTFAITTGTTTNGFVFSNPVSCPGSGTMSERFGVGANAGSWSLSVGQNSQSDSAGAAFGRSANAAINSVALGNFAYARSHNVAIGDSATAGSYLGSIAIGESATCTTSGQMVVGSASLPVNSMKLITDSIGGSLNFVVTSGNLTITPSGGTTTFAGTVGTKILSLVSTATNDDPTLDIYQNRVATTDATVTTLHTIAIADETAYALTATVLARRTGGVSGTAGDSAMYTFSACVMRTGAGIATLVGTSTPIVTLESQAGWDCVFDVDGGNNARVRVTGAVGNNITFHLVELKVSPLSS